MTMKTLSYEKYFLNLWGGRYLKHLEREGRKKIEKEREKSEMIYG